MLHPRARTMLLLSLPAVAIGIASSLILIVVMKIASVLQNLLWQRLPGTLGIAQDSPLWIIGVLTLTGIAVGLVIRFSQGHAGPDPACEPLIGAPVPPSALPGLIVALILGLAGGVSLGPEHPIMTVNIALAVAIGARLLPRVNRMEWTILASAGTIGALFGTPVAAALIFSQTLNGSSEVPLWDRLFAPLMAAAAGALMRRAINKGEKRDKCLCCCVTNREKELQKQSEVTRRDEPNYRISFIVTRQCDLMNG
ncbi:ion channel protein [uncultured Escherichia sp.]|uniref:ion channel protein n=1 Tax=Escherichia coli TaxID=562 RepID=UPI0025A0992B|nr:ion channel protein [uncultured Escherichia sp.]